MLTLFSNRSGHIFYAFVGLSLFCRKLHEAEDKLVYAGLSVGEAAHSDAFEKQS